MVRPYWIGIKTASYTKGLNLLCYTGRMIRLRPKTSSGYTIIEVMIVLAISGAILGSAILLFQGSQGRTAFDVAVQDANSEITSAIKEVNTAVAAFPGQYNCTASGAGPVVSPPSTNNQGTNTGCIVLGQALWPHGSQIDSYTVVGCQYKNCDSTQGDPATLTGALSRTHTTYLKQTYTMSSATVLSSKVTSTGTPSSLIGFYINLSGSPIEGSTTVLQLNSYSGFNSATGDSGVDNCLKNGCGAPALVNQWTLCLQSPYDNSRTATINVNSTSRGISTITKFESCT